MDKTSKKFLIIGALTMLITILLYNLLFIGLDELAEKSITLIFILMSEIGIFGYMAMMSCKGTTSHVRISGSISIMIVEIIVALVMIPILIFVIHSSVFAYLMWNVLIKLLSVMCIAALHFSTGSSSGESAGEKISLVLGEINVLTKEYPNYSKELKELEENIKYTKNYNDIAGYQDILKRLSELSLELKYGSDIEIRAIFEDLINLSNRVNVGSTQARTGIE